MNRLGTASMASTDLGNRNPGWGFCKAGMVLGTNPGERVGWVLPSLTLGLGSLAGLNEKMEG